MISKCLPITGLPSYWKTFPVILQPLPPPHPTHAPLQQSKFNQHTGMIHHGSVKLCLISNAVPSSHFFRSCLYKKQTL